MMEKIVYEDELLDVIVKISLDLTTIEPMHLKIKFKIWVFHDKS